MFGGKSRGIASALAVAALLGAAGCGGDDGESTASDQPKLAVAGESATAFANRMAKLIETSTREKDCAQLEEINTHSYIRFDCPAEKALRRSMADFEIVGVDEYATGAVVDYKSGTAKDGAAIVLALAIDRKWGITRFGLITPPSAGTSDEDSRAGYDKAVDDYLAAVRERDCAAFFDVAVTNGKKQKEVCQTTFATTKGLAKRIEQNPTAKPVYIGGNGSYGFFSYEVEKPKPEAFTISVVKATDDTAAPYVVLDVAPSLTKAAQRETRQDLKKQLKQKKKGNPGMEPSSKPSDPAVTTP